MKKQVTVTAVKKLIRSGITYSSQLAKHFKVSKQYMGKFLARLVENGKIEIDIMEGNGKVAKYYRVVETQCKPVSLWGWVSGLPSGLPYFRDGVSISYGILNYDEWFVPDKDWKLGNTLMKGIQIDDVYVRIANDKTLTFIFSKIYGNTPIEPIVNSIMKSLEIKKKFLRLYPKFKLTENPTNTVNGCLGTTKLCDDIKDLDTELPITTQDYTIDATPTKGSLEIPIKDPLDSANKLKNTIDFVMGEGRGLPERVSKIETELNSLISVSEKLTLVSKTLQESLMNIITPFQQPEPNLQSKQKTLDFFKEKKEELNYIG